MQEVQNKTATIFHKEAVKSQSGERKQKRVGRMKKNRVDQPKNTEYIGTAKTAAYSSAVSARNIGAMKKALSYTQDSFDRDSNTVHVQHI